MYEIFSVLNILVYLLGEINLYELKAISIFFYILIKLYCLCVLSLCVHNVF